MNATARKGIAGGANQLTIDSPRLQLLAESNDAPKVFKSPYEPEHDPTKGPEKFPPDLLKDNRAAVEPHHDYARPILPTFDAHRDIVYVKDGGKSQSLDVIVPKISLPNGRKFPVVVWIHGGGWRSGSKDAGARIMPLINAGIAVVSINYRLSGEAKWPAQIYDCKAAIRWVRAHGAEYNINASKIGVWGASAGGHLVALLGTSNGVKALEGKEGNLEFSSDVQAVCDWFGPTDLKVIIEHSDKSNNVVEQLLGSRDPVLATAASPITYVSSKAPPFLIVHGDKDPLVPLSQSQNLNDALKKAGADVSLKIIEGAGHGQGFKDSENAAVVEFFKQHLHSPPKHF
jgi:acetyl esterase/lipase